MLLLLAIWITFRACLVPRIAMFLWALLIAHFLDGVGLARICIDKHTGRLHVERMNSTILGNLGGYDMLFDPEEPRFGAFSVLLEDGFIYLYGTYKKNTLLARVPMDYPHARTKYQFWNGVEYVENIFSSKPVMYGMQQGAVFKSSLFGKDKPWVTVGCTCWRDSLVMVGAAGSLEGPWEFIPVTTAKAIIEYQSPRYCIYPHTWLFDEEKGELAVSWSEVWPGNVIMAKLKFAMRESAH